MSKNSLPWILCVSFLSIFLSSQFIIAADNLIPSPTVVGIDPGGTESLRIGGGLGLLGTNSKRFTIGAFGGGFNRFDIAGTFDDGAGSPNQFGEILIGSNQIANNWRLTRLSLQANFTDVAGALKVSDSIVVGSDPRGTGKIRVDGGGDFKGTVRAQEVIVTINGWSDHVFAPDYRLAPLSEVAKQIESKRHLPGIPSESEILEKGLSMGEMQRLHMAKIEELTLYAIQADSTQRKLLHEAATQQAANEIQNQQLVRENLALAARLERIEKVLAMQASSSTTRP